MGAIFDVGDPPECVPQKDKTYGGKSEQLPVLAARQGTLLCVA